MKNPSRTLLVFTGAMALLANGASAQSVTLKRIGDYRQSGATTIAQPVDPYLFEIHIRGGTIDMSNWGPTFYKPGSGGIPQAGTSNDTSTGTLNFSTTPNNGTDYAFTHVFESDAALAAFYPTAPVDGGQYGIKFSGSTPPSPTQYTAGLIYSDGGYPTPIPQIVSADNDAKWSGGILHVATSGTTTLTLNSFPEYSTATHGALVTAGIWDPSGDVVDSASVGGYRAPSLGVNQAAPTTIPLNGAELAPGVNYTLEIQYGVLSAAPANGTLNANSFMGSAGYYKTTRITVKAGSAPSGSSIDADFNGDGQSDVVWQNTANGNVYIWMMGGTDYASYQYVTTLSSDWRLAGTGDFNGDGKSDLVWYNTNTGNTYMWFMDGANYTSVNHVTTMSADWTLAGTGDFDGDGKHDIVWRNLTNGNTYVWLMNGANYAAFGHLATVGLDWRVAGSGDFNSDGKSDLLWQNTVTGESYAWMMNGTTYNSYSHVATMSPEWRLVGGADFNADGKGDLLWHNTANGNIYIWLMNGTNYSSYVFLTNMTSEWRIAN